MSMRGVSIRAEQSLWCLVKGGGCVLAVSFKKVECYSQVSTSMFSLRFVCVTLLLGAPLTTTQIGIIVGVASGTFVLILCALTIIVASIGFGDSTCKMKFKRDKEKHANCELFFFVCAVMYVRMYT